MSKYWSNLTKILNPYVPGEQPKDKKYIKLNTNENPYPPSAEVLEAIKMSATSDLRLYPDPNGDSLKEAIAAYYGVKKNQVFIGNGSDEVLAFSFMAFFNKGEKILYPDVTYSFYDVYSNIFGLDYEHIPLKDDFSINIEGFLKENGGIIFPNPNAPTGKYMELEGIERILETNTDKVVIVDEAYIDFGGKSVIKYIDKYQNLLSIQTLSKSRSLAGLRVGFAIGNEELIDGLNRVKNSFNSYTLDSIALNGALKAFSNKEYFEETTKRIISTRYRISDSLRKLGFFIPESKANFIFISHASVKAEDIFIKLKEKGVLVRYFKLPRIDNYLRVSIGTDDEMDVFLEQIENILGEY